MNGARRPGWLRRTTALAEAAGRAVTARAFNPCARAPTHIIPPARKCETVGEGRAEGGAAGRRSTHRRRGTCPACSACTWHPAAQHTQQSQQVGGDRAAAHPFHSGKYLYVWAASGARRGLGGCGCTNPVPLATSSCVLAAPPRSPPVTSRRIRVASKLPSPRAEWRQVAPETPCACRRNRPGHRAGPTAARPLWVTLTSLGGAAR
jgi:hypothetical protein